MPSKPKIRESTFERAFILDRSTIDEKKRTVELAFSSEIEVLRWFGVEILDHSPESVNLARLLNGGAALMDHNRTDQVGVVESARVDADRKGRAIVRFGKSVRANEIFQDVVDGIRQHVSVGYRINEYKRTKGEGGKPDVVRATKWTPYEISFVSVPADDTVGVGRSLEEHENHNIQEGYVMPGENKEVKTEKTRTEPAQVAHVANEGQPQGMDVAAIRADAIKEDRVRVAGIERAFAQVPGIPVELKRRAIESGMSEQEFRAAAFDSMVLKPGEVPHPQPDFEKMRQESKQDYSLIRAIAAQLSGDWTGAGFEREVSKELAREHTVIGGGLMVPASIFGERADMTTGAGLYGDTHLASQFIDTLRAETMMGRLGARFIPGLVGSVSIPKKTGNATFGFVGEGDDATPSDVPVGKITMAGKHISGLVPLTFELIRQSSPAIEDIVRADMLEGMGLAIDGAAFNANGTGNNPLGILATPGIHTVTATDTTNKIPTWAEVIAMEAALEDVNALKGKLSYITRATIKAALKQAKKDAGSGEFVWKGQEMNGYKAHATTQVPVKTTLFGNFTDVLIGLWGVVELIPKRNEKTGGLDIGVHQMIDIGVRRAESFCKIV